MEETHYDVLGVPRTSTQDELKTAYHGLIVQNHPDKNPDSTTTDFIRIDKAWKVLRDPETRRNYDADLKQSEIEGQSLLFGNYLLKDLNYDPENETYSCECRCGGLYNFSKKDSEEFNSYLVGCDECSLMISVDLQT